MGKNEISMKNQKTGNKKAPQVRGALLKYYLR
jgi:hypothetical protein